MNDERCPVCGKPFTANDPPVGKPLYDGSEMRTHASCDPLTHAEVVRVSADFRPGHHPEIDERVARGHRIGHVESTVDDPTHRAVYLIPPLH